jgi:hypothetical protein
MKKPKFAQCANTHAHVSVSLSQCPPSNHFICFMVSFFCHLYYVVFVMCITAHNSTMWKYFYFLFLYHISASGFEVICTVTSCLKGHLSYS